MSRQSFHPPAFSLLLLACALGAAEGADSYHGSLVVEDFEGFAWGEDWGTVQFSQGADPRMTAERSVARSGKQSCRLMVPPGETLTLVSQYGTRFTPTGDKPPLPLPGVPDRVGVWVYGAASGHRLWLRLLDAEGKSADVALGGVDFHGWKLLDAPVPKLAPPLGLRALLVSGGKGPLVIDDVTVTTSCQKPLHVGVRPAAPDEDFLEGRRARFRVTVQSLGEGPATGRGTVLVGDAESPAAAVEREHFTYRAAPSEPFSTTVTLRLDAGVHWLAVRAGGAECGRRVVVYREGRASAVRPARAVRRFGGRGDALRVYESALSPAVIVEACGRTLTLFRGLPEVGLTSPRDGLTKVKRLGASPTEAELDEPWALVCFGASPAWTRVTFADGTACPTFDVPFLIVTETAPERWHSGDGVEFTFGRSGERVAIMPLHGIRRLTPAATRRWRDEPETIAEIARACRFWVRALRAFPIDVEEEWRIDADLDVVEMRARFSYLESASRWGGPARRMAPVPPMLILAREAGLPVRFSKEPVATGCWTSVGPYYVVPDADEYTCTISGVARFVHSVVVDLPAGVPSPPVALNRNYRAVSDDVMKIPFWSQRGGEEGRRACEALLSYVLSRQNARYACDEASGTMRAFDGLAWERVGQAGAAAAAAEHLRGCWYAGQHAGLWELVRERWRHVAAIREGIARDGDWATLGLGPPSVPADARVNAEVFFARTAARLGKGDEYTQACVRAVKLLVAASVLANGALAYTEGLAPWPSLAGRSDRKAFLGGCEPGSVGFVPGLPPFVTDPSDAGYGFAAELLGDYFRREFRSGQLDFYGRTPAEWSQRLFATLAGPGKRSRFVAAERPTGPYATNYVFSVEAGPDGWPALAWHSHRSPKGGPLIFGSIGSEASTRGKLESTQTPTPWLRLSAYSSVRVEPPPKAPESPPPPKPEEPSSTQDGGIPDRSLP